MTQINFDIEINPKIEKQYRKDLMKLLICVIFGMAIGFSINFFFL